MALAITNTNIGSGDGSARLVTYDNLDELDTTPGPIALPEWADRSVQVTGTFNGGTLVRQCPFLHDCQDRTNP